MEHIDLKLLVQLIMSACVLHNFCLQSDDFDNCYFLDHHDGNDGGIHGDDDGEYHDGILDAEAKFIQLMNIIR